MAHRSYAVAPSSSASGADDGAEPRPEEDPSAEDSLALAAIRTYLNTLVLDDDLDAIPLELIVKKAEQMHAEYGFVPPFIANADILSHLSSAAARHRLAPSLFEAAAAQAMEDAATERSRAIIEGIVKSTDLLDHDRTERIRDESFYGHANVSLALVEDALERSREETGSVDAVAAFVAGTLSTFAGLRVTTDDHGVFTITGHADELAGVLPNPETRLSFRPEDGFADPDIDVVDIAHPLLRRLIDIIRDQAAHPDASGRVAARTSPDVGEVGAIGHLLVRYVAHADPPVLMEELVTVPLPVWGQPPATDAAVLLAGPPGAARNATEIPEAAVTTLAHANLEATLDQRAQDGAHRLATGNVTLDAPWAAGLDRIEVMSRDLLAITIIWPEKLMTDVLLASCSGGIVNQSLIEDLRGEKVTGDAMELANIAEFTTCPATHPSAPSTTPTSRQRSRRAKPAWQP